MEQSLHNFLQLDGSNLQFEKYDFFVVDFYY